MKYDNLQQILTYLKEHQDEDYRAFNESLIPGAEYTSIGVRMPVLQALAKKLCRENWQEFLNGTKECNVYEVVMLRGLVTAYASCDIETKMKLIADHVPSITNWALCDCFCGAMKDTKRHLPEMWTFLRPYFLSREAYPLRFAIVMLMDYFLCEEYIEEVLDILADIEHEDYYVNMALAWAFSVTFVKHRDRTLHLLEEKKLSPWVQNKAIQKCRESRRVSPKDKELLKSLRI